MLMEFEFHIDVRLSGLHAPLMGNGYVAVKSLAHRTWLLLKNPATFSGEVHYQSFMIPIRKSSMTGGYRWGTF